MRSESERRSYIIYAKLNFHNVTLRVIRNGVFQYRIICYVLSNTTIFFSLLLIVPFGVLQSHSSGPSIALYLLLTGCHLRDVIKLFKALAQVK